MKTPRQKIRQNQEIWKKIKEYEITHKYHYDTFEDKNAPILTSTDRRLGDREI